MDAEEGDAEIEEVWLILPRAPKVDLDRIGVAGCCFGLGGGGRVQEEILFLASSRLSSMGGKFRLATYMSTRNLCTHLILRA